MKALHMVAFVLLAIGGVNWGLVGLSVLMGGAMNDWNVVNMLVGTWPTLEALVYVLVGLSAVWLAVNHTKDCTHCMAR